jgi:LysR family transcriptional regulator, glycine cleavage system transcriptional activator
MIERAGVARAVQVLESARRAPQWRVAWLLLVVSRNLPAMNPHFSSQLRSLATFCIAARALSFKLAASRLFLTPSAVSHQIRDLEQSIGSSLFVRKTRELELTPLGESLLADVEPALRAIEVAMERVAGAQSTQRVLVSLPPFFASELLIPRFAALRQQARGFDVILDTRDTLPRAPSPGADLTVFIAQSPPLDFVCHRLFELTMVAACAPRLLADAQRAGTALLTSMPVLMHRRFAGVIEQWAANAGCAAPASTRMTELDDMYAIARAAEQGLGIAVLPAAPAVDWFRRGVLVAAWPEVAGTGLSYYLGYGAQRTLPAAVLAVRDWFLEEFTGRGNFSHPWTENSAFVACLGGR